MTIDRVVMGNLNSYDQSKDQNAYGTVKFMTGSGTLINGDRDSKVSEGQSCWTSNWSRDIEDRSRTD